MAEDQGSDGPKDGQDDEKKQEERKQEEQKEEQKEEQRRRPKWPLWLGAGIALAFVVVLLLVILLPHARVKTDDAYVTGHYATVAPRIAGQVASVEVDDNQPVRAGQLLVVIDDRDYRTALDQALANERVDRARVDQADAAVARQPALIRQAEAQVTSARARLALAQADQRRYANLASTGAGSLQQRQQADAALVQAEAALAQAEAEVTAQVRQLDGLRADAAAARARVGQDRAAVEQARLNLGYTRLVAPIAGTVGEKSVQAGNTVAPGAPLMTVVPLDQLYVTANYREIELRHMRPGQPVKIHVDSYDVDLAGTVASLPPASGATFSPIPPNNATGNFTKIVQRLPVKIVVNAGQPLARLLRAGMSVETVVDTGLDDVVARQRRTDLRVTAP